MNYDMTARVAEVRRFFDDLLDKRIDEICAITNLPKTHFIKINPADFIERNGYQTITGYTYQPINRWIERNKQDDLFLISPLDAVRETSAQVSYKMSTDINRTIRASKCECMPVPAKIARDFFVRNHRQTLPNISKKAVSHGLIYNDELVAVMLYDIQKGAVRGNNSAYELLRLAIAKGTKIHGGASKLQHMCEQVFRQMGVTKIYSYSNATINTGAVYERLGFTSGTVQQGQPFVIMEDNRLERLINLSPETSTKSLAQHGRMITRVSGNRVWIKHI